MCSLFVLVKRCGPQESTRAIKNGLRL
jgi:hypothetical protein